MPALPQWDYIFVICLLFAALDAYNIGANDVANSFGTSVSSRSLSLRQAILAAAVCEFLGAVLVGAKVSGTIKNSIISIDVFDGNAGVAMLAFTCALVASATWLMIATKNQWPVSTTYSIVSALAGVGVAVGGWDAPSWGWNGSKGLGAIWAGMVIAPALAGAFGSIVYLITKYAVLERKNPVKMAMYMSPVYFFIVAAVLTMSIVYKGSPELALDELPGSTIAIAITMTALVVAILSGLFWLPYVYCVVVRKDPSIRWYHFFYGPLLWKRPVPEIDMSGVSAVPDYRVHGRDQQEAHLPATRDAHAADPAATTPSGSATGSLSGEVETKADPEAAAAANHELPQAPRAAAPLEELETGGKHKIVGNWYEPSNLYIIFRYKIWEVLSYGFNVDIHKMQQTHGGTKDQQRMAEMLARSQQYPNETEHLYSFLQVLTACTNSFAHGANDVANAVGPFAAVYHIWQTGAFTSKTPTPTWILAFGAAMLVIGLATYGYKIFAVIGNRITLMSPSRGFSMELGSAITVLLASQYGIPVSTTMCIIGATIGVGLVSSGATGVNWRSVAWIYAGWILTIPVAAISAGCLAGIILNAPRF